MTAISLELGYPTWLERWWLDYQHRCEQNNEFQGTSLDSFVRTLSDLFTKERPTEFKDYAHQAELRLAYGLFFFPQTFVRAGYPLAELIQRYHWRPPPGKTLRLLDLGAGFGAASFRLVSLFQQLFPTHPIELHASDTSLPSLQMLEEIARDLKQQWPGLRWQTTPKDLRTFFSDCSPALSWDWIVTSFSLNEAFHQQPDSALQTWVQQASSFLSAEGFLLILEPATLRGGTRLEALRDAVLQQPNLSVWGPCLHQHNCPLLHEQQNQCHEVRSWTPPDSLVTLNRHLHRSIHSLKFSFLLLARRPPTPAVHSPYAFRIVTPVRKNRAMFTMKGCNQQGQYQGYELLQRKLSKPTRKQLQQLERGDIFQHHQQQELEADKIRIQPTPVSFLHQQPAQTQTIPTSDESDDKVLIREPKNT